MPSAFFKFLFLALITLSVSAQGTCGEFPDPGFDGPEMRSFSGQYENPNYDFGVTIPPGLTGHDGPAPNPHHGFGIVLSWEPRSYIWVDGSYNSAECPNSRAALKDELGYLRDNGALVFSVKTSRIKFGAIPSLLQVAKYKCPKMPEVRIRRLATVIRNGIIYTIGLDTPEVRDKGDSLVFNALLTSWHLTGHDSNVGLTTRSSGPDCVGPLNFFR